MLDWADGDVVGYERSEGKGNLHAQGAMPFAVGKTCIHDNKLHATPRKHYRDHNARNQPTASSYWSRGSWEHRLLTASSESR